MMTESQALEALTRQDPEAAGDAKAALAWLTGDEGLEVISLLRLQEFLWYALPVKWPMSTPGRVGVAKALGRLFMLAGLDRYAGVCSSAGTERIITAYAAGHEEGITAYTEAIEASNAAPPDTDLLAWGSVMGPQERAAYDACAAALELAFASGELCVGARGWRTRRVELVNRWLTGRSDASLVRPAQAGEGMGLTLDSVPGTDTWLGRISAERIDAWAHGRPGERSRLARVLIPRLLEPPALPDDPLPTLRWLLGHADEGLRLTARYYISPALVTEAVDTFGWRDQLVGTLRQELDVFPLHTLRGMAQTEMGAIRRSRTSLVLTRTGKLMATDPAARWHIGTAALIGPDDGPQPDFSVAVREAALLVILDQRADRIRRADQAADRHPRRGGLGRGHQHRPGQRGAHRAVHPPAPAVGAAPAGRRAQLHRAALAHPDRSRRRPVGPAGPGPAPSPPSGRRLIAPCRPGAGRFAVTPSRGGPARPGVRSGPGSSCRRQVPWGPAQWRGPRALAQ